MENTVILTKHGVHRSRERIGIPKKAAQKKADTAFVFGIEKAETTGSLRKYFDTISEQSKEGHTAKIYDQYCYIFHDNFLITVLHLPNEYKAIVNKMMQQKRCAVQNRIAV